MGRIRADKVGYQPGEAAYPLFNAILGQNEIWVVARWRRYEDGREEALELQCLDPEATEQEARKAYDFMVEYQNLTKKELQDLVSCFEASEEDLAYIENRFPDAEFGLPANASLEERDLYLARLKVLAGMQPKTVEMIHAADSAESDAEREKFERKAVQAYFAEMAHQWTEDEVLAWQKSNPVGTDWLCEFARVLKEPERDIDPINHELVLNWLRKKYNLLTAEELSDMILVRTGQRLMPGTLKKRRERLGLTTERPPGPKPNSDL